jgi:hypothetical protein
MQFESKDDFMAHFGVKGMKWGVRKDSSGSAPAAKSSEDHKRVAELRTKPTHSLSNAQLKVINERLQLESTYSRLDQASVTTGRAKVEKMIKNAQLANTLISLASSPAGKATIKLGKTLMKP